ncbi:hypothetical protein MTR67_001225 [Solanum verrucosum]|uniref:Uncharacterized protein n=1 Tax=Solanum verrucosum TaxID=315347 RepID=A0AAF0TC83_SOLVR|nr:hypothetical protein MTR67_001225 [Solanum verrucosum]
MGSVENVEEERKELAMDVHKLARLGVHLMIISDGGVMIQNGAESSLVVEVKEMQDSDPILHELKGAVHRQRVEVFSQGGDSVLHYQGLQLFASNSSSLVFIRGRMFPRGDIVTPRKSDLEKM